MAKDQTSSATSGAGITGAVPGLIGVGLGSSSLLESYLLPRTEAIAMQPQQCSSAGLLLPLRNTYIDLWRVQWKLCSVMV